VQFNDSGTASAYAFTYSDVEGGATGAGNISVNPQFGGNPAGAGTWTTVEYNNATAQTRLVDTTASWSPGTLRWAFVRPDAAIGTYYPIANNTATELYIWGNFGTYIVAGSTYEIIDVRLSSDSPCIDAANGPEAPTLDLEGNARVDDPSTANTGLGPPWADMGAYEFQP
jgi:hypothetical protein